MPPTFRDGQKFNPWCKYSVAKEIRAFPVRILSMGAKITWQALADRTSEKKGYVWPAYERIAADTGVSRRQAIRYVSELIEKDFITVTPVYADGRQKSNRFEFLYRSPVRSGDKSVTSNDGDNSDTHEGDKCVTPTSDGYVTQTFKEVNF